MKVRIDHYIVGARRSLRDILDAYAEIGFITSPFEATVRHQPGLRTGFLYLSPTNGGDYIEFLTVEDRKIFEAAEAHDDHQWSEEPCAQGVGIRMQNAPLIHKKLADQGTSVKPVWSKRPEGAADDTPLRWSFVNLETPQSGLGCFYVEYLIPRPVTEQGILQGTNGIYAMGGLLVDCASPNELRQLLDHDLPQSLITVHDQQLRFGCHDILALPFKDFIAKASSHDASRSMRHHPDLRLYGALLYTDSLTKTEASLRGKWKPYVYRENEIFLLPTEFEGLAALIREKPIAEWQAERCREEWIF